LTPTSPCPLGRVRYKLSLKKEDGKASTDDLGQLELAVEFTNSVRVVRSYSC
jgi:hypothetical protein